MFKEGTRVSVNSNYPDSEFAGFVGTVITDLDGEWVHVDLDEVQDEYEYDWLFYPSELDVTA